MSTHDHTRAPDITAEVLALIGRFIHEDGLTLDDNFFAVGGSSLAAANFTVAVSDTYDVSLSLRSVFAAETLGEIVNEVTALLDARESVRGEDGQHAAGRG